MSSPPKLVMGYGTLFYSTLDVCALLLILGLSIFHSLVLPRGPTARVMPGSVSHQSLDVLIKDARRVGDKIICRQLPVIAVSDLVSGNYVLSERDRLRCDGLIG